MQNYKLYSLNNKHINIKFNIKTKIIDIFHKMKFRTLVSKLVNILKKKINMYNRYLYYI